MKVHKSLGAGTVVAAIAAIVAIPSLTGARTTNGTTARLTCWTEARARGLRGTGGYHPDREIARHTANGTARRRRRGTPGPATSVAVWRAIIVAAETWPDDDEPFPLQDLQCGACGLSADTVLACHFRFGRQ